MKDSKIAKFNNLRKQLNDPIPPHFIYSKGVEPYAFYWETFLNISNTTIADLGTYQGLSAAVLSANPTNYVYSYDINLSYNLCKPKDNIKFIEGNIFDYIDDILACEYILVDVDPHDGYQEIKFFRILLEKNYKGITLWDDLNLNEGMRKFWTNAESDRIIEKKIIKDGHHSGTGYISF